MIYEHILVATDFSSNGDAAVERALELARTCGSRLTLLHVLPAPHAPSPLVAHYDPSAPSEPDPHHAEAIAQLRARGGTECECVIAVGDPADEILSATVRLGPDLVVLATRDRSPLARLIAGSVAERVLKHATVDVLAVRVSPSGGR